MSGASFIAVVLFFLAGIGLAASEPLKRFETTEAVFNHYWRNKTCESYGNGTYSREELDRAFRESREGMLGEVRTRYSPHDYDVLKRFFFRTLPQWAAKDGPILLFPCYADKVLFGDKPCWVVCLDWEAPYYEKGRATLGHIFVLVVDGETAEILGAQSCG